MAYEISCPICGEKIRNLDSNMYCSGCWEEYEDLLDMQDVEGIVNKLIGIAEEGGY